MDAYIGLGSNLGDRSAHLRHGLRGLAARGLRPHAQSSVWESEPVDAPGSGPFLNMVVAVRADRSPIGLLDALMEVERSAGRVRTTPGAPRTLDLDLLLVGRLEVQDTRLELPHPRMWARRFVLAPLAEIAPELRHPLTGLAVAAIRDGLPPAGAAWCLGPLEGVAAERPRRRGVGVPCEERVRA